MNTAPKGNGSLKLPEEGGGLLEAQCCQIKRDNVLRCLTPAPIRTCSCGDSRNLRIPALVVLII